MPERQREISRIIDQYKASDREFPARVNGLFSGLLVDETSGQAVLFNDRFGYERVFKYEDDEAFLFSSEAKAILAVAPKTRSFDPVGLSQFLACGCTLGEVSLFHGIRVLPPGTVLKFARRKPPQSRKYFERSMWEGMKPIPDREFVEELGRRLETAVTRHATQDPSVAVSLTGGLDSRMIMACLKVPDGAVPCYTFGSMYRETYDVRVAARVARQCGQPHQALILGQEFVAGVREFIEKAVLISDGYLGLSGAAELYLNRLARGVAPTRITGNYGGELLRGFRAFKSSIPRGDFLRPEGAESVENAMREFFQIGRIRPISFTLFYQAPAGYGRYAIERSQVTVRSPFLDNHVTEWLYRNPGRFAGGQEASVRLIGSRRPDLLLIPTDRGLLGTGWWLRRRARRVHSEALFKAEYWTGHGAPHWVAALTRYSAAQNLERLFVGRHKFLHPRPWVRSGLGEYARRVLIDENLAPLAAHVDLGRVKAMLQRQLSGDRNYWEELDKLITIALTCRLLLRPPMAGVATPADRIGTLRACSMAVVNEDRCQS
jgi:asparagine synthase (glutamine-hydrolysing)